MPVKRVRVVPVPPEPGTRLIGYGRVSTNDQNPELQRQALLRAGVHPDNLHIDEGVSGAKAKRRALSLAFLDLRPGDTLIVWKLDRLGRDLSQLIAHAQKIKDEGAHFKSLTENIDTTTPSGMFFFHMIAAMAQWERAMISERTKAGMAVAKASGKVLGRAPKWTKVLADKVRADITTGDTIERIAKRYKISESLIRKKLPRGQISKLRKVGARPTTKPKRK